MWLAITFETRSRTKVFRLNNEHGCSFGIQMHVDTLKYVGKLNNRLPITLADPAVHVGGVRECKIKC